MTTPRPTTEKQHKIAVADCSSNGRYQCVSQRLAGAWVPLLPVRGAALSVATRKWPEAWMSAFDRCEPRALPAFSYKSSLDNNRGISCSQRNCLCSATMSAHVLEKCAAQCNAGSLSKRALTSLRSVNSALSLRDFSTQSWFAFFAFAALHQNWWQLRTFMSVFGTWVVLGPRS